MSEANIWSGLTLTAADGHTEAVQGATFADILRAVGVFRAEDRPAFVGGFYDLDGPVQAVVAAFDSSPAASMLRAEAVRYWEAPRSVLEQDTRCRILGVRLPEWFAPERPPVRTRARDWLAAADTRAGYDTAFRNVDEVLSGLGQVSQSLDLALKRLDGGTHPEREVIGMLVAEAAHQTRTAIKALSL